MSRVVLVSNRVATPRQAELAGGVAVALADVLKARDGLWFGWSGRIEERAADAAEAHVTGGRRQLATLGLTQLEYDGYYLGYANSVIWPVFHNRVDLARFEAGFADIYTGVNERFAAALAPLLRPDDFIWVHDYHFIPLARALRAHGITNRIGFFLHIPFPPAEAFLTIPEHPELAEAFAAYDLVGLQTTGDVANMIDYLGHGAHGRLLPDGRIRVGERIVALGTFPVGIDASFFAHPGTSAEAVLERGDVRRIIGVDRLDYTKGLPQKFRGFGRFLEQNSSYHERVILTQIAAPSRESVEAYSDIRKELESLSGAINGLYGELDWVPIHYINRSKSRAKLAAMYRGSVAALVTPLRDGMNLVAKEYVAAQDPLDPGVLILSRFAGAAEQLTEALIVNPYNENDVSGAISRALEMPLAQRRRRHAALLATIIADDAAGWSEKFLHHLARVEIGSIGSVEPTRRQSGRMQRAMRKLRTMPHAMPA